MGVCVYCEDVVSPLALHGAKMLIPLHPWGWGEAGPEPLSSVLIWVSKK